MKCGRVQLCERRRGARGAVGGCGAAGEERPRRYCQRKLVDPALDEDPRWDAFLERFRCDQLEDTSSARVMSDSPRREEVQANELVLTVLNINFPGDHTKSKYNRSCFKYKMPSPETNHNSHRMFVKKPVDSEEDGYSCEEGSQVDCKFHDYVKNIINGNESSRPSSSGSSVFYHDTIVQHTKPPELTTKESKPTETPVEMTDTADLAADLHTVDDANTTVKYQSVGKRRSLTISRAQSPETVQVIRVDVVCNYSGRSSVSSNVGDGRRIDSDTTESRALQVRGGHDGVKVRAPFASRYFLTNTVKQLEQNASGGDKVTLLCKTFKLATRSQKPIKIDDAKRNVPTQNRQCRKKNKIDM